MKVRDIFLYMLGHREAIRRIAGSRWSLLVGALLCISAGVARHYDGHSFIHQPWWLVAGIVVGGLNALVTYGSVRALTIRRRELDADESTGITFWQWLSCFWLTAPCAWLYAWPVERGADPIAALKMNMTLLAIVASWRVLLMTRVAMVTYALSWWRALAGVLAPAACVMTAAVKIKGKSFISMMMGYIGRPEDKWYNTVYDDILVGCAVVAGTAMALWLVALWWRPKPTVDVPLPTRAMAPGVWVAAVLPVVLGLIASIPRQRQVATTHRALALYDRNDPAVMIRYLSAHSRDDLVPAVELPPNVYSTDARFMDEVFLAMDDDTAPWVRQYYIDRYAILLLNHEWFILEMWEVAPWDPPRGDDIGIGTALDAFTRYPEGRAWISANTHLMEAMLTTLGYELHWNGMHDDWAALFLTIESLGVRLPPPIAVGVTPHRDSREEDAP